MSPQAPSAQPLISVIVPAYNQQRYIKQCLRSILSQSYPAIEVIVVNDASTDQTPAIATKLACRDSRLKVLNQPKNQGVDLARFRGIAEAKGEFLTFVDADDWIPSYSLEVLYHEVQRTDADIVEATYWRVFDSLGLIKKAAHPCCSPRVIKQPDLFRDYYISFFGYNKLEGRLCAKLIRKALFEEAKPKPSGMSMCEDMLVSMQLLPYAKCYSIIDRPVYYYRWGGSTSRYKNNFYTDLKRQYFIKKEKIAQYDFSVAIYFTKIEMCNVLFSECVQQLRFGKGLTAASEFLQGEIDTGFIDEVANGYETKNPKILLLRRHDKTAFLAMAQAEANHLKWLRKLVLRFQGLLRYI